MIAGLPNGYCLFTTLSDKLEEDACGFPVDLEPQVFYLELKTV
jgi:hypothetical protein